MGQIQVLTANPAIEPMQREMATREQSRRLENQDFRQRYTDESARTLDKGLRQGIGSIYATPSTGSSPTAAPVAPPSGPGQVGMNVSARAAPTPTAPPPPEQTGMNTSVAPTPSAAAPASVPAATQTSPTTAPSANVQLINKLQNTQGAGNALLQLHAHEQATVAAGVKAKTDRQKLADAAILKAILNNDQGALRIAASTYGVQLPDEVLNNPHVFGYMSGVATQGHRQGLRGEALARYVKATAEAQQGGKTDEQQSTAGWSAAATPPRKLHTVQQNDKGQPVQFFSNGETEVNPDLKMAPKGTGANAGGDTAANRTDKFRIKALVDQGVPEATATSMIIGRNRLTPKDVASTVQSMMKLTDGVGRPLYKNIEQAQAAAEKLLGWAGKQVGGMNNPNPNPPVAAPRAITPATNNPAATPKPQATGPVPQRPAGVPPGSMYSPSRRAWRDAQGKIYNEQGQPVNQQPDTSLEAAPL